MKYLVALVTAISLVGSAACTSSSTSPTTPSAVSGASAEGRAQLPTIAGIAVGNSDFSTLVAALSKAGLVATFDGNTHYTVFAPTNAAFDAAAEAILGAGSTGLDLVNALDVETLTAVLKYHVTLGDRNAKSVLAAGSLRMLDDNWTTVRVNAGVATIDSATIVATDLRASNGYVHVIDGVILPPSN